MLPTLQKRNKSLCVASLRYPCISRTPARFTQADVARTIRAAKQAGAGRGRIAAGRDDQNLPGRSRKSPRSRLNRIGRLCFDSRHAPPSPAAPSPGSQPPRQGGLVCPCRQGFPRSHQGRIRHTGIRGRPIRPPFGAIGHDGAANRPAARWDGCSISTGRPPPGPISRDQPATSARRS